MGAAGMKLRLQAILQESQLEQIGAVGEEHAQALVVFFIEHDGKCSAGCARIKQTVGARFATDPLEVGPPLAAPVVLWRFWMRYTGAKKPGAALAIAMQTSQP